MRMVNRSAVLVRPKEAYANWAKGTDPEAPGQYEGMPDAGTIYLLPEADDEEHLGRLLRRCHKTIFENELAAWVTDEAMWPAKRDWRTFQTWFEVQATEMVLDLGQGELQGEEI